MTSPLGALSTSPDMSENNTRKLKLGQRWVCYECDARFYDLNRPEPLV